MRLPPLPPLILGLLVGAAVARDAAAIPAFARKYTAACGLCHALAYPALNDLGRRFKENGYQLEGEPDTAARAVQTLVPDPDERLALSTHVPLGLRAQGSLAFAPDPGGAGRNGVDLHPLQDLFLLAGASVYPNLSFLAAATIAPEASLHHAAIGFHDLLFGADHLNLRVGRLLLLDFSRPGHRFLTAYGNPTATTPIGLNPTVIDSAQQGIDLFGRLWGRRLLYRVAIVQGAEGPDGVRDLDPYKDLFAELHFRPHHLLTVGLLGYRGRTQITDDNAGVRIRFTDAFHSEGAFLELDAGPLNLFAQILHVDHQNPFGDGQHADTWGYRAEARAWLGPTCFLVGRYDQLSSHHLRAQAFKHATVHLGWLALTNLRLALESAIPLNQVEASTAFALMDIAF